MIINQISVFLENRAGQLSEITSALSEKNIDLRAINIAETADYGVLRLITEDTSAAADTLLEKGFIVKLTPVISLSVPNRPGGLNELLLLLAKESIDIEYMYSIFSSEDGEAHMIMQVSDAEKVEKLLAK